MSKDVLYELVTSNKKPDSSRIKVEGDIYKWYAFLSLIDIIDPNFNIMTPLKHPHAL